MKFLPFFYDIRDRRCLIVGGGTIGARKAAMLREAGARVTLVAATLCDELAALAEKGVIDYQARNFEDTDIEGHLLIVAATDDEQVNLRIATLAKGRDIPVNVADNAGQGTVILPSVIDRSPVQIAVTTGGASPMLARMIKTRLESCIPSTYGRLASLVESYREQVKGKFAKLTARRKFWEAILSGPIAEQVLSGRDDEAEALLQQAINDADADPHFKGEVYLVGAGPGDPDLLSFRALRLMQQADVVVYDRLVSKPILELVRRDAERIYAGKERSKHAIPQENINQLLADLAKQDKRVLRLKGGDPFIFGRGGEEIETLIEEGVPFQVVPGITAAAGCASYSGIPLTHRDYAQACIFVTGHLKDDTIDLNWDMLAHQQQTIVFYMGLQGVKVICEQLIKHGLTSKTAAALITKGTTPDQRVLIGDLDTLPDLVKNNDVKPPTLIIVGDVVKLHEKLRWFKPGSDIEAQAIDTYTSGKIGPI